MNRWVCTKCGETALSKCVYNRSVFPSDEHAAVMSHLFGWDVRIGPEGEYVNGQRLATASFSYSSLISKEEAEAMTEIELRYETKPHCPTCRVGPKPVEPEWLTPKKARVERGMDPETYKQFKAWYKIAKAEYDTKVARWEEAMNRHHAAMAEYNERFKAWQHYEENRERVWEHNQEARRLRKEHFRAQLTHLLGAPRESLEHWLCCHDWVLTKGEGDTCSLGCTHRKED